MITGRAAISVLCGAAALASAGRVSARERIAVLILPVQEADTALADDLTEVAISRLAESSEFELVGTRELRRRLAQSSGGALPLDCSIQPACLGRLGVMLGAHRLVSGNVRRERGGFLVTVAVHDIALGKVQRSFFRAVDGNLESVGLTIQAAIDDLFLARPAAGQLRVASVPDGATVVVDERLRGTTPVWIDPLEPGLHAVRIEMDGRFPWSNELRIAPGQSLLISVSRDQLASRRTWAPYAAYGSAGAAVLAFAAAGVFGTLARVDASGRTRGDTQNDLEMRMTYATITNLLLVAGAALSGISAFTFIRFRRDIARE